MSFMMDNTRSSIGAKFDRPMITGSTIAEDGLILKRVASPSGGTAVAVSTGAAGDDIVGVANVEKPTAFRAPVSNEEGTIPASSPYTIELAHANVVSGSVLVVDAADGTTPITPASFNYTTGVITFDSGDAGTAVLISYTYTPTVAEAVQLYGEGFAFQTTQNILEQCSVICGMCEIFTLQYVTDEPYAINDPLYVTSEGRFSSEVLSKAFGKVTKIPTASDPYLGVSFLAQY